MVACVCLLFSLPFWLENHVFSFGGDIQRQWFPFYKEIRRLIVGFLTRGELPFYSWISFLGNNYWASKSYYGFFDFFNYLTFLLDNHFYNIHHLLTVTKIIVSAISFFVYAKTVKMEDKTALLLSLCYSLSSWALFFSGQSAFLSFYAIMPFYFTGMELYLQKGKFLFFILMVALCLFTNYYFFYTISFFSPFYFLYRYYHLYHGYKGVVIKTLKCICCYFVGVMMTGIMTLPTVDYMLSNQRVGVATTTWIHENMIVYLHHVVSLLAPSHTYLYYANVFDTADHVSKEVCAWAGTITALLVPQFLTDKDKEFKYSTLCIYLFFIVVSTPAGSSAIHGFSEYSFRWMLLLIFMNLFVAGRYLSDTRRIHIKNIWVTAVAEFCLIIFAFFGAYVLQGRGFHFDYYMPQICVFGISCVLLIVFALIFQKKRTAILWVLVISYLELSVYAYYNIGHLKFNIAENPETIEAVSTVLGSAEDLNYYLIHLEEENSSDYFRVYVPTDSVYWDYSYNMNIIYELKGVTGYDSTFSPAFTELQNVAWSETTHPDFGWKFDIKESNILSYLATKYSITTTKEEIPFYRYEIIGDYYGLYVAKNLDFHRLGTTYSSVMTFEEYVQDYWKDTSKLLDTLLVHWEIYDEIQSMMKSSTTSSLYNISYGGNSLFGTVECDADSFMVITLPYDEGWNVQVNNQPVKIYKAGGGMIGIPVNEGINSIEMYFVPVGLKTGILMSTAGVILFAILCFYQWLHLAGLKRR